MILAQNVFLIGPVGAGKSTIGRQLATTLKMEFFDSDREIEKRCGVDIDWIFDLEGEKGFRQREQDIINELANRQGIILATGGGAVVSLDNRTVLSSRGKVVYLQASIEQQLQRTAKDKRRPLLQVEDKESQLIKMMKEHEPLYREISDITVETSDSTVRSIVQKITHLLMEEAG